ncbi:MAG TPA: hypothetical protein VMU21_07910 [Thermodesulfovibrionales bacterium]|nr:hypothetical protein [Thermodesulfovibrionales bacterium]
MSNRKTINKKMTNLLTGVFVTVVATLFVMSFAIQVNALESKANLKGEVVAVDDYAKTMTVKSMETVPSSGIGMNDNITFTADKGTYITSCTQNRIFNDINTGAKVAVTYHELDGKLIADVIDIAPVVLAYACYDE